MNSDEQEYLDRVEARLEREICQEGEAFYGNTLKLKSGPRMNVDDWLRSRGRADLVEVHQQNKQAYEAKVGIRA